MTRIKTLFISILIPAFLLAVPAKMDFARFTQPDGTTVRLRLIGDEFFSLFYTADGIPVAQSADGSYCYVTGIESGQPVVSAQIAHEIGERKAEEVRLIESIDLHSIASRTDDIVQVKRNTRTRDTGTSSASYASTAKPGEYTSMYGFPTIGQRKGLLLLVEFPDLSFHLDDESVRNHYEEILNKQGYSDPKTGAIGSVRDYFEQQSFGQFSITFQVVGPIMADNNYGYYGQNNSAGEDKYPRQLVQEICQKVNENRDELGVDFGEFDNNKDGVVDALYLIYAGNGEHYPGVGSEHMWPHTWELQTKLRVGEDNYWRISSYSCSNELLNDTGLTPNNPAQFDGIGSICHEFSHLLGLMDMYDTTNSPKTPTLHSWSIMDYGNYGNNGFTPVGMTALERFSLGWMDLTILDSPGSFSLPDLTEGTAYRLNTDNTNKYLILETHNQKGWFEYQPAAGLLVTSVDYNKDKWLINKVNTEKNSLGYTIIPADNNNDSEYKTQDGDLFPYLTNDSLTRYSTPSASVNKSAYTTLSLRDIRYFSEKNGYTTFWLTDSSYYTPVASVYNGITIHTNGNTLTLEGVSGRIQVFSVMGTLEKTIQADALGKAAFSLNKGIHIIKCAERTFKVVI